MNPSHRISSCCRPSGWAAGAALALSLWPAIGLASAAQQRIWVRGHQQSEPKRVDPAAYGETLGRPDTVYSNDVAIVAHDDARTHLPLAHQYRLVSPLKGETPLTASDIQRIVNWARPRSQRQLPAVAAMIDTVTELLRPLASGETMLAKRLPHAPRRRFPLKSALGYLERTGAQARTGIVADSDQTKFIYDALGRINRLLHHATLIAYDEQLSEHSPAHLSPRSLVVELLTLVLGGDAIASGLESDFGGQVYLHHTSQNALETATEGWRARARTELESAPVRRNGRLSKRVKSRAANDARVGHPLWLPGLHDLQLVIDGASAGDETQFIVHGAVPNMVELTVIVDNFPFSAVFNPEPIEAGQGLVLPGG